MFRIFARACAATVVLCAACTSTQAAPTVAPPAAPTVAPAGGALLNVATITRSASTNTPGIVVVVRADGVALWDTKPFAGRGVRLCREDHGQVQIDALAKALLEGIPSDVRLADLPVASCAKPASFGTTTTLEHFNDKSGDLSCPATDPRTKAVADHVDAVMRAVLAACG